MMHTTPGPIIEVQHLTKAYHTGTSEIVALRNLSFKIYPGQMVALMGPYGSGKSTLMSILGLLDTPTGGRYWLNGQEMTSLYNVERTRIRSTEMGIFFQHASLSPRLSLFDNVELPLRYALPDKLERRYLTQQALNMVGLSNVQDERPHQVDRLQKQLAVLARAIVHQPKVLLIDELTSPTDDATQTHMTSLLQSFSQKQNLSVVLVTHNPNIAQRASRIIGLRDGQLCSDILDACYDIAMMPRITVPAQSWSN